VTNLIRGTDTQKEDIPTIITHIKGQQGATLEPPRNSSENSI